VSVLGKINLNDNTRNHPQTLRDLGYTVEVSEDGNVCHVECEGFLPQGAKVDSLDWTSLDKCSESLRDIVEQKLLIGYNTRIELPGGIKRFGAPLCKILQEQETLQEEIGFDPTALVAIKPKVKRASLPKDLFASS
jgi:hypothetical protein